MMYQLKESFQSTGLIKAAWISRALLATAVTGLPALSQANVFPIAIDNSFDKLTDPSTLHVPATASSQGMWVTTTFLWPLIGLHLSVLPSGQVLSYGSALGTGWILGTGVQDGRTFDIWDPRYGLGITSHTQLPNVQNVDSFCSSSALLPSGVELISGGSSTASNDPAISSSLFSPASDTVTALGSALNSPRWYATMTSLPNGTAVITGGGIAYETNGYTNPAAALASGEVSMTPELYTPTTGWTSLFGATSELAFGPDDNRYWYPHQWVAPNGTLFGISANQMWYLNTSGNGSVTSAGAFTADYNLNAGAPGPTLPNIGPTSTAVMYSPGHILQVGGNGLFNNDLTYSSSAATTFDITQSGTPVVSQTSPMNYGRQWANSLVLPDGNVLVTGGSAYGDNNGVNAVYPAEIWNPATGQWTLGASAANYRGYHSATALLPDGVVLSTGGGAEGPVNNFNGELYYPPYLFTNVSGGGATLAPRPQLISMNANTLGYGDTLKVELNSTATITKVTLVRLSATTHSFNTGQLFVQPAFSQSGNIISVTIPTSANTAPPGYYIVTAFNAAGTPSRGAIVGLGNGFAAPPAPPPIQQVEPSYWTPVTNTTTTNKALKFAIAADGTLAEIDANNVLSIQLYGRPWTSLPGSWKDVALINGSNVWAIDLNGNPQHWDGSTWTIVGVNVDSIAASSDGGVVDVNGTEGTVWQKVTSGTDNVNWWVQLPFLAKRVAASSMKSIWYIGTDDSIYFWNGSTSTRFGSSAHAIAAGSNGEVIIISSEDGSLWFLPAGGGPQDWYSLPGAAYELAWRGYGSGAFVTPDGNVYRQ